MIKKEQRNIHVAAYIEIVLMIGMTFSFAYIISQSPTTGSSITVQYKSYSLNLKDPLLGALKIFDQIFFNEKSFVSALETSDLQQGAYTCPLDKNGSICQQYPASECANKCSVSCIPSSADQIAICKIGTCYDPVQGTCQTGAPQSTCEGSGGQWFNDINGNVAQCKLGCCMLGTQTSFVTAQQCTHDSAVTGLKKDFRPEVNTEIACLALSQTQEQGACVLSGSLGAQNTCKFTTRVNCEQDLMGKFYSELLCSNPSLGTNCKQQTSVGCVQGKDEVYWFDSCGNQENIYDANKVKSFDDGKVLSKNESCLIGSGTNLLANQATCGNCNYLAGSICGTKTAGQHLSDSTADVVCKDLSCVDGDGKKRVNGESWCAYQGSTGADVGAGGYLRSTDTVGSRSFRETCMNGELRTDPCADYRNEICTEAQTTAPHSPNGKISSAACRINLGYQCYEYNKNNKTDQCDTNPDCFVKHVQISGTFKFDFCAPREVPGFDLNARGEGAASICAMANQKCTVVYVKELTSGWTCKANCDCEKPKYAEQMNDLCISLGDCGSKANYLGDFSKNSKIFKSSSKDKLGKEIGTKSDISNTYINGLVKYANEKLFKGKYIDAKDTTKLYDSLGIPGWLGQAQGAGQDPTASTRGEISTMAGMGGLAAMGIMYAAGYFGGTFVGSAGGFFNTVEVGTILNPGLGAAMGAISGAADGLAVVSFLLDYTGVGRGLPPFITYGLMAAGAVGGAMLGIAFMQGGMSAVFSMAAVPIIGWIILIVVIIVILILMAFGIGDTRTIYYTYQCNPWQALSGGSKCSECGSDGFPCSQYSCSALGQNCQLINEETGNPSCVNIAPNDVSAPVISPISSLLPDGFILQETDNGVQIKASGNGGCLTDNFQPILFGISLNEPGQCKIDSIHTDSFSNMDQTLDSGLYTQNHSIPLVIPSLESLGVESFNPNASADYNIYLRCQDKSGNFNQNEYNINFCIKPGNDSTPPLITNREPYYETVAFDTKSVNASIYTNEPANCNWDAKDTTYELMANNFSCGTGFEQRSLYGWQCNAQLPFLSNETKYYVRCLDQPWLTGENASKRNANTQSYQFNIKRSSPLKIDSINVDGQNIVFGGVNVGSVDVEVKTSGGLDGTARCAYIWGNSTIDFFNTWQTTHSQVFQSMYPGPVELPITCTDLIGNSAQKTAKFKISLDNTAPIVTRVYANSGTLNLITNEPSTCYYSVDNKEKCLFDMDNVSSMNGLDTDAHSIQFDTSNIYYVKCKDKFNNYPGVCSIVVRGGNYETQQL